MLESERAFERLELTQTSMYDAIAFSTFLNAALILSATLSAGSPLLPVRVAWTLAGVFGLRIPVGLFKVRVSELMEARCCYRCGPHRVRSRTGTTVSCFSSHSLSCPERSSSIPLAEQLPTVCRLISSATAFSRVLGADCYC